MRPVSKRTFLKAAGGAVVATGAVGVATAVTNNNVRINGVSVPAEADPGQSVAVSVTLENRDDSDRRTVSLQYRIDGENRASTGKIKLDPGEIRTVAFKPDPTVPGSLPPGQYTQGVFFKGKKKGVTDSLTVRGPDFRAADFRGPTTAVPGQQVSATVTITNRGTEQATRRVSYKVAGETIRAQNLTLDSGESVTVGFSGTLPQMSGGRKTQGIYFDGANKPAASSTIEVRPATSRLQVTRIDPQRSSGDIGREVSIDADVENLGDAEGQARFEYRIGGVDIDRTNQIELAPGESQSIELNGEVPDIAAGSYRQGVYVGSSDEGLTAPFRVTSEEASFSISTLEVPGRAQSGDEIAARARVANLGREGGSTTVQYRIDDEIVAQREVSLDPGSWQIVVLRGEVPERAAGRYEQGVFVGSSDRGFTAALRITAAEGVRLTVSGLRGPAEAQSGTKVTVRATITNIGAASGNGSLEYRIDGVVLDEVTVDLQSGRSTTVEFSGEVPDFERGNYRQGVFAGSSDRGQTTNLLVRPRPGFGISALEAPGAGMVGDRIEAALTVHNRGEARDTRSVSYSIGGESVAEREVTLAADERRTITLQGEIPELTTGIYTQWVAVGEVRLTAQIRVQERPRPPARFTVGDLRSPASAMAGEEIEVQATVGNTGGVEGTTEVQYRFDGRRRATSTVDLGPNETTTVTYTVTMPNTDPGTYQHGIFIADSNRGQTSAFVIEDAATPTEGNGPGFGPLVAAAGATGAAYLLGRGGDGGVEPE